jgi:predicted amino acid-binding ACT domain protein
MNKTILLVSFIPLFAVIGKILAYKFTVKREFYEDFNLFINMLESEINFTQNSIDYVIKKFPNNRLFINKIFSNKISILSNNEQVVYNNFFSILGKVDILTQKQSLTEIKNYVKDYYESAKKIEIEKNSLYFKLSILLGILTFIIFI